MARLYPSLNLEVKVDSKNKGDDRDHLSEARFIEERQAHLKRMEPDVVEEDQERVEVSNGHEQQLVIRHKSKHIRIPSTCLKDCEP